METWTHKETGISWLKDLLPKTIPQARILTFGYDTSTLRDPEGKGGSPKIDDYADELLVMLENDRDSEHCSQRPIIFICHGHGGNVLKRALIRFSYQTFTGDDINMIFASTFAVFFFSTPHITNSSTLQATDALKALVGGRRYQSNKRLSDDKLTPPLNDLKALVKNFDIYFMWELNGGMDTAKNKALVAPDIDKTARLPVNGSHSDIVKFCESDPHYGTIKSLLMSCAVDALEKISDRWENILYMIARARATEVSRRTGIPLETLSLPGKKVNEFFYIPQLPSDRFIGRTAASKMLNKAFFSPEGALEKQRQKRFVIFGIGGSGKTQLCCQFAKHNEDR